MDHDAEHWVNLPPQWSFSTGAAWAARLASAGLAEDRLRQAGVQSPWQLAAGTQLSPAPPDSIPRAQTLTCDQRAHDDMGRFGLHHRGLLCTVSGRRRGRGTRGDAGLSLLHLLKRGGGT